MTEPFELTPSEALERFREKARCRHTQGLARSLHWRLRRHLTPREDMQLVTAWVHAVGDEGPAELDSVCAELAPLLRPDHGFSAYAPVLRVGGDATCSLCGAPWREHPTDLRLENGDPTLRRACDGRIVKT